MVPNLFRRAIAPCFVFRPDIFARACWRKFRPRPERCLARTAWGDWLEVQPRKFVGGQIYMRGVHDLPVCEILCRLVVAGDTVVDAGANLGVMTSLLSIKVGAKGRVLAFEAHPDMVGQLRQNTRRWNRPQIEVFHQALSRKAGVLTLYEGDGFELNEGTARIGPAPACSRSFEVQSIPLDDALRAASCGVMKIDVEGYEFEALSGAMGHLATHRIRDVVFESTWAFPGPAHELLLGCGYRLFEIRSSLIGPKLVHVQKRSGPAGRLADYLATVDAARALDLVATAGWKVLNRRAGWN